MSLLTFLFIKKISTVSMNIDLKHLNYYFICPVLCCLGPSGFRVFGALVSGEGRGTTCEASHKERPHKPPFKTLICKQVFFVSRSLIFIAINLVHRLKVIQVGLSSSIPSRPLLSHPAAPRWDGWQLFCSKRR